MNLVKERRTALLKLNTAFMQVVMLGILCEDCRKKLHEKIGKNEKEILRLTDK